MAKLYFRYGAMNCGKSATLLQVAFNYEEQNMKVILIKPKIDTKKEDKISSRIGIERKVDILLNKSDSVLNKLKDKKINAIIVDETQFLKSKQIDELYYLSKKHNIPVLCYGLRCDFKMKGFEGSTRLLQIADDIEEIKTICKCGSKATQNIRMINKVPVFDGEQVVIDNNKLVEYEAVCGKCYIEKFEKIKDEN